MDGATRELDLVRMRRDRVTKLQEAMDQRGIGALLLLTSGSVLYATGARVVQADNARVYQQRPVALVVAGDPAPHLFTPYLDGAPPELPIDHLHPPLYPETQAGVVQLAGMVKELLGGGDVGSIGVDDYTAPMWFGLGPLLAPAELVEVSAMLTELRLYKTPDEIECMRRSWEINEAASYAAEAALRPGVRLNELSGPFLGRLFELGATCNFLDPVWQAMPPRIEDGPWSANGDVPFNLITNDHIVSDGEVIWTDTVMGYEGYASDVGRTWVVGHLTPQLRELRDRWEEITDAVIAQIRPGVTGDTLTRTAIEVNGGTRPWLDHFFLAHGLGLEGGEPQRIGSDLGESFDESFVLAPGMALVVEPVVWQEGHCGWRCEELLIVTEDGHEKISQYPNERV